MTTETFILVAATNVFTFAMSTIYYASRVDELRRQHQARLEAAEYEVLQVRKVLRRTDAQRRVYGAVPVSRLIDPEGGAR